MSEGRQTYQELVELVERNWLREEELYITNDNGLRAVVTLRLSQCQAVLVDCPIVEDKYPAAEVAAIEKMMNVLKTQCKFK